MEGVSRIVAERYIQAQPFIRLLRKNFNLLTMEEYREIRRQAIDGDIEGAYDKLNQRLEERRKK